MFNNLEKKIKAMRPKQLTMKEKNLLWSNIEHGLVYKKPKYSKNLKFNSFNFKKKFILIPALIIALLGGSTITAFAANEAKPGDTLFPVDLAIEKMQIILAPETKEAELRIKFAKERFEEAKIILAVLEENYVNPPSNNSSTLTSATSTETAQQSGDIASSTETTNNNYNEESDIEHKKEAAYNLGTSIGLLEQIKETLEESGDKSSVSAVEGILEELSKLTEGNEVTLDRFKTEIKKGGDKIKIEIKASNDTNNFKLKFEQNNDDKKVEIKVSEKDTEDDEKKEGDHKKSKKEKGSKSSDKKQNEDDENEHSGKSKKEVAKNKVKVCHNPSDKGGRTIKISEASLAAHINHGDTAGECDEVYDSGKDHKNKNKKDKKHEEDGDEGDGNNEDTDEEETDDTTSTSTPDIISPEISNITSSTATTSTEINWNTNEISTTLVWYSTSTPISTDTAPQIKLLDLTNDHTAIIENLTANTTYYFVVGSADESSNIATSTENSFKTLQEQPPVDTTPPEITGVSASATTTSATITWSTDEGSTSTVWYSTSIPLTITESIPKIENLELVLDHSVTLSDLTASTTYYYMVSSADTQGNTSTSTELIFSTTQ